MVDSHNNYDPLLTPDAQDPHRHLDCARPVMCSLVLLVAVLLALLFLFGGVVYLGGHRLGFWG